LWGSHMHSKDKSRRKAAKGSVQIKSSNERLQLVFSFGGKRHYISTGFSDSAINRKSAEMKARQIELDIASGNFDITLEKYKPNSVLRTVTPIESIGSSEPSLAELWDKFIDYKTPQCAENTMRYTYGVYTGYMKKLPTHDLQRAVEIRDFILKSVPVESARRFITRLSACCDWALESGLIHKNPFVGMAREIKVPKSEAEDCDIDPFTADERDTILQAIANNRFCPKASGFKHSYYLPLITFLFKTGCRPSEAVALKWGHITDDLRQITFQQRAINTRGGRKIAPGLKNGKKRRVFPCNASLRELLQAAKPKEYTPDTLIFPSPEGLLIDTNNFRNRVWKRVLEGLGLRYRKLYQTRHTFITLALESVGDHGERLDAKDVAHLVLATPLRSYTSTTQGKSESYSYQNSKHLCFTVAQHRKIQS